MSALSIDTPLLRPLRESDLDAVMAIEHTAYPYPWTAGIFRDCLHTGYNCWALETDKGVSGYGVMSILLGECHILNVCVAPALQKRGLGMLLLDHLLNLARQHGANTALLEVRPSNKPAIALYEKMGFTEVGLRKHYYPAEKGREDGLILALEL